MEKCKFIISGNGTIIFSLNNNTHSVGVDDPNREEILQAVLTNDWYNVPNALGSLPEGMRRAIILGNVMKLGGAL